MKKSYWIILAVVAVAVASFAGWKIWSNGQREAEKLRQREVCVQDLKDAYAGFEAWQSSKADADYDKGAACFEAFAQDYETYLGNETTGAFLYIVDYYAFATTLQHYDTACQAHIEDIMAAIKGLYEDIDDTNLYRSFRSIRFQIEDQNK